MLSSEPLPPGHRAPVAAVAAAAAAARGDVGLRARAITAMWPALRALGRVPCLRDVGTDLSRVVYHEVFLSLQVCFLRFPFDLTRDFGALFLFCFVVGASYIGRVA